MEKKGYFKIYLRCKFFSSLPRCGGGVVGHSIRVSKNNIKLYPGPSPPSTKGARGDRERGSLPGMGLILTMVIGFADGEGCLFTNVTKNNKYKTGFKVELFFSIGLHERDKALLQQIQ